jgi:dTDP-4-amino-4,6-dideoxygalactose transaminase
MPNINAALGCAQLEQLPEILASKRRLFKLYQDAFQKITQVRVFAEPEDSQSNYWLQTLLLDESVIDQREKILEATNDVGLMTRPVWELLHELAPYRNCSRAKLPVAESLKHRILNLPSSTGLV